MATRTRPNEKIHYIASTTFTIDRSYTDLKLIGKGSYGVVCSALDMTRGRKVAIKKITPMAKTIADAKHVLREIRLMRYLGVHENIITLEDLMVKESADELYIVMELLDSDLHRIIQSPQVLTEGHVRHFMHQLLCGVKYMHDNRIIHRDLKPGNLLVTRDCKLRITDFGLARERPTGANNEDIDEPMTEHVVTRWYRPPELMLCPDGLYTYAVDIWSVGCIFAELLARRPLFPGKNFIHQLNLIFDVIGCPLASEVRHIVNNQARKFLESQVAKRKLLFPELSGDGVLLLNAMLIFNPSKRLSADKLLELPYFDTIPSTTPSLVFPQVSDQLEFTFERSNSSKHQLKSLIVAEVASFKRSLKPSATLKRNNSDVDDAASQHTNSSKQSSGTKPRSRSVDPRAARNSNAAAEARNKVFDDLYRNRSSSRSRYETREKETKAKHSSSDTEKRRMSNSGPLKDSTASAKHRPDSARNGSTTSVHQKQMLYGSSAHHLHDTSESTVPTKIVATHKPTSPVHAVDDYDDVSIEELQPRTIAKAVITPERPHQGIGYKHISSAAHDIDPFESDVPSSPSRRNKHAMRCLDDDACSKRALDELTKQSKQMHISENSAVTATPATVSTLRYNAAAAAVSSPQHAARTIPVATTPTKPETATLRYHAQHQPPADLPSSPPRVTTAAKPESPPQRPESKASDYGRLDHKRYDSDDGSVGSIDARIRPETKYTSTATISTFNRSHASIADEKPQARHPDYSSTAPAVPAVKQEAKQAKGVEKKRKVTVPQSPKFSKMSWQRREAPAVPPAKPRAVSNPRGTRIAKNISREILEESDSKRLYR